MEMLQRLHFFLVLSLLNRAHSDGAHGFATKDPIERNKAVAALLARLESLNEKIADHAKDLTLSEAKQIRNRLQDTIKHLDAHHRFKNEVILDTTTMSPPIDDPQPSECGVIPDPFPSASNVPLGHRQKIAKEQQVPLSYFEAGYNGNVSTGDPRVFGPDAWRTLHRFSIHYPESPTNQTKNACENFLGGLPYMIPCPHCGYHLREFIVLNEQYSGQLRGECLGRCEDVKSVCATNSALVSFFTRAHNNVNVHNYKKRPNWTVSDVYFAYASGTIHNGPYGFGPTPWLTQGPIDGKCQLIRSVGENVTGSPDFLKRGLAQDVLHNLMTCAEEDTDTVHDVLV